MKLLLHSCCAPCSGAIIESLLKDGIRPLVYYCNPNIFPKEEYIKRKDECSRYAIECGLEFVDADYDHSGWLECVKGMEDCPERGTRCSECFHHRLLSAARYALDHGYDTLATTLASSRWKNLDQVNEAGRRAVEEALAEKRLGEPEVSSEQAIPALTWWDRNWRKGGLQERRNEIIRERNFYNQLYCGCEFSAKNR